ncbi:Hemocyte protein-glutamine gamma-glutamyltransferase [Gryllus bimaculatus]|nr:Hemocyte protein-glutamine gamma-glutamyltransferase [Gryllus bimaculatus]
MRTWNSDFGRDELQFNRREASSLGRPYSTRWGAAAEQTVSASKMAASDARSQESAESARCRLYARLCDDLGRRQRSAPSAAAAPAGELPEGERALRVQLCELYGVENGFSHNTQRYFEAAAAAAGATAGAAAIGGVGSGAAVLRRGLPFALALRFDRPCDTSSDALTFIFTFEGNKRSSRELVTVINVDPIELPRGDNKEWYAAVQTAQMRDKNTATFKVMIPCSARVGIWNLTVRTYKTDLKGIRIPHTLNEYHNPDFIYVLFNPWCKEDGVYLPGEASRRECVQASEGKVWLGCARDPVSAPWVFAQYAPAVLPCAVLLLQAAGVAPALRGDPARVAHALARAVATRLVTFKDDDGVPVDSWARERANDGVPGQWTGSVAILEEYLRTLQPVRCTQSWSAHGCDDSLAIDCEITRHGLRPLLVGNAADEVWSFQMWNEVWAARPDLPEAYSGWQAVDATLPAANGRAGSGPAPVEAIKHGLLGLGDEVRALHARVNGDRFLFQENPDDPDWLLHPVHQEQDAREVKPVT